MVCFYSLYKYFVVFEVCCAPVLGQYVAFSGVLQLKYELPYRSKFSNSDFEFFNLKV